MTTDTPSGPAAPESKRLRCHRCGSVDLMLSETTYEHHRWWDGVVVEDGRLWPLGEAIHDTGEIVTELTVLICQACKHRWRPRRSVGGPYETEVA